MLTHLTWHQFFLTAGGCLLLYYLVVGFLCYRHDIRRLLSRLGPFLRSAGYPDPGAHPNVMGAALSEVEPVVSDAAEVLVAPPTVRREDPAPGAPTPDAFHPEAVAGLLEELQALLEEEAENRAGKEDFCALARLLISNYAPSIPDRLRDQVSRFLLEQTRDGYSFELTAADVQGLWPAEAEEM